MIKLIDVQTKPNYRLLLKYSDGVQGEVDFSSYVGTGVFVLWNDPKKFENVRIGSSGELSWSDEVDMIQRQCIYELQERNLRTFFRC